MTRPEPRSALPLRPVSEGAHAPAPDRGDERLQFALEVAGLGQWDLDLERGTAFRSLLHDQIFGYDDLLPEWTYELFLQHVVAEDRDDVDAAFRAALDLGTDWDVECRIRRADGVVRWIWARGRCWQGITGTASRMLGIVGDITARKEGEAALRASEQRFHRAIAEAPFPILLHASDGEILQVSRAFTEITGYTAEEVPTIEAWTGRAYGTRREAVRAGIRQLHDDDRRTDEGEFVVQTRDGHERVWSFSSAPLGRDADGRSLVISMAADVTERKRAETDLRQMPSQLLAAGEHERRRVARELHDELGGLLTSLQISLAAPSSQTPADLAESRRLVLVMLDKVRDLSLDLRPSLLDDLGLVPALDQLLSRFTDQTRITVDSRFEVTDQERFATEIETTAYRVVQEALTNVARHAGVDHVQVLCHREPDALVIHVVDEGRGFDVERVDLAASTGLSGIRERAALSGGRCEMASTPGMGTRVTVELPLARPAVPPP